MTQKVGFDYKISKLSSSPKHHFFEYYGINPWDKTGRYHLALQTEFHTHRPTESDVAKVGLIDRETHAFNSFAQTSAFNLQQGSMMYWIGEEFTMSSLVATFGVIYIPDGHQMERQLHLTLFTKTPAKYTVLILPNPGIPHECRYIYVYIDKANYI